ncbi:unnamed protein product [Closterium sp. Naga37s-1]|nr:unnamed protein product [Closterium sp. Naga37s-1]
MHARRRNACAETECMRGGRQVDVAMRASGIMGGGAGSAEEPSLEQLMGVSRWCVLRAVEVGVTTRLAEKLGQMEERKRGREGENERGREEGEGRRKGESERRREEGERREEEREEECERLREEERKRVRERKRARTAHGCAAAHRIREVSAVVLTIPCHTSDCSHPVPPSRSPIPFPHPFPHPIPPSRSPIRFLHPVSPSRFPIPFPHPVPPSRSPIPFPHRVPPSVSPIPFPYPIPPSHSHPIPPSRSPSRSPITPPSLPHHSPITPPSLPHCSPITPPSLPHCSPIAPIAPTLSPPILFMRQHLLALSPVQAISPSHRYRTQPLSTPSPLPSTAFLEAPGDAFSQPIQRWREGQSLSSLPIIPISPSHRYRFFNPHDPSPFVIFLTAPAMQRP